ncbi:MAG: endonuclease/exonuclease/phosphatase family protein [Opitutaceae bacterium]|nr:endonuclease/exonuclease/phosphatase family protein [Opitutaceae bacterium]
MLRVAYFVLAAVFVVCGVSRASDESLTVATYNIRRIVDEPREYWTDRRPLMVQCIRAIAPDVMGTQEALYPQIKDLESDLPEFRWVGLGRDGGSDDEFCAVFYRVDRLEPLAFGHFWLSDYPEVMGSITWGTQFRRMCTWVRLRDRRTGREFSVWNTHFDHQVQEAREKSAELIRDRAGRWEKDRPVIVLGDFNSRAGVNPAYEALTRDGFFTDTWDTAKAKPHLPESGTATFNGWGEFPLGDARIDWILTRGPWTVERVEIVTFAKDGRYPSDHFPVVARLRL